MSAKPPTAKPRSKQLVSSKRGTMRNPKRGVAERQGIHSWMPYYAGYAENFVEDALCGCLCDRTSIVLDPMNGSGTTTVAAQRFGCLSLGFDLNPVMAIIANSKDATLSGAMEVDRVARNIVARAARRAPNQQTHEAMGPWLNPGEASQLHAILSLVQSIPDCDSHHPRLLKILSKQREPLHSGIKAFLLAAVLITARSAAATTRSKNPTWLKPSERRSSQQQDIRNLFLQTVSRMQADLISTFPTSKRQRTILVAQADARSLPITAKSVDAIITSPPYLTRIDYAVSTAPELALLGHSTADDFRRVRASLMGSTCVTQGPYETNEVWGKKCSVLVAAVRAHQSKSSASYYAKTFIQYFRDAEQILREYHRVLKADRAAVIVVQDSWYKDIHIPLGEIYVEMALQIGFRTASVSQSSKVRSHLGLVNTRARAYAKGDIREHVLILRK